jgi:hypothetical protein
MSEALRAKGLVKTYAGAGEDTRVLRGVDLSILRGGVTLAEIPSRRAARRIEDAPRRDLHVVQALQHARGDLAFEPRGLAVGARRALEAAARQRPVNPGRVRAQSRRPPPGCAGRSSPGPTPSGRPAPLP